jgi:hypothetical protein
MEFHDKKRSASWHDRRDDRGRLHGAGGRSFAMRKRHAGCLIVWLAGTALAWPAGATAQTLKERLSDKASDEQRVDNCRVPPERRGTTPRPDCAPQAERPPVTLDNPQNRTK